MSQFLIVTWEGGGNRTPALGMARALVDRGHDVRLLGHSSIDVHCGDHGSRFRPFTHPTPFDPVTGPPDATAEFAFVIDDILVGAAITRDVLAEVERERPDVLIVDAMLLGGLSVGEAMGIPTVALFHTAFALFRGGPFVDMASSAMPGLNALRAELGLDAVTTISEVHDACASSLVASFMEFEPELPIPPNVRFVGPFINAPSLVADADRVHLEGSLDPLILVSFSTGQQGQLEALQQIVDALADLPLRVLVTTGPGLKPDEVTARPNTEVVRFVPHDDVLPRCSLVITHCGHGTVMRALRYGVPLLCMPIGRDQFFNAARVEALGVGRAIPVTASAATVHGAALGVLDDPSIRCNGRHVAALIAGYGGEVDAVNEVERLCRSEFS